MAVSNGVTNEFPVPSKLPPVAASYQLIVPADAVAFNVTIPGPQRLTVGAEVIVGIALIVAVTNVLAVVEHEP